MSCHNCGTVYTNLDYCVIYKELRSLRKFKKNVKDFLESAFCDSYPDGLPDDEVVSLLKKLIG